MQRSLERIATNRQRQNPGGLKRSLAGDLVDRQRELSEIAKRSRERMCDSRIVVVKKILRQTVGGDGFSGDIGQSAEADF